MLTHQERCRPAETKGDAPPPPVTERADPMPRGTLLVWIAIYAAAWAPIAALAWWALG